MKEDDISSKDTLRAYVHNHAKKRGIPLRKIGEALGVKPPYFSDLINGKKKRSVEFLNALADYLETPRVEVYQAAGWLDLDKDDLMMDRVTEWATKDPNFRQAIERMMTMSAEQRDRIFSWILYKTLQETNRSELIASSNWEGNLTPGEIRPETFAQLNSDQRQALSGVVQIMLEAFLAKEAEGKGDQFLEDMEQPQKR